LALCQLLFHRATKPHDSALAVDVEQTATTSGVQVLGNYRVVNLAQMFLGHVLLEASHRLGQRFAVNVLQVQLSLQISDLCFCQAQRFRHLFGSQSHISRDQVMAGPVECVMKRRRFLSEPFVVFFRAPELRRETLNPLEQAGTIVPNARLPLLDVLSGHRSHRHDAWVAFFPL
jgi:hypothetical protein